MIKLRGRRRLEFLTKKEIYNIHSATLEVLKDVGVKVRNKQALKILDEFGVSVDYKNERAYFPEYIVDEAIKNSKTAFNYYGRNYEQRLQIENGNVYFLDGGTALNVVDLNGEYRRATLKDLANFVRLYDALPNVDFIAGPTFPTNIPENVHHLYDYLTKIENTSKPFTHAHYTHAGEAKDLIKLALIVAGGFDELLRRPSIMGWENPVSPLTHDNLQIENLLEFASYGLPVLIAPAVQSGATGPASLGGVLVQQNAEILSGFVLVHAVAQRRRRSPLIYGTAAATFDMRFGTTIYSSPEAVLLNIASVQLAKYYNVPCRGTGGVTETYFLDMQAGYETSISLAMLVLAGCNLIMDATGGALGPGVDAMSFEKAVIDNEIVEYISWILKGINISKDTLAVDVIRDVIMHGKTYLSHKHTMDVFQQEHFMPRFSNRKVYRALKKENGDIIKRANREVRKILREHKPTPIDKNLKEELIAVIKKIEKEKLT
ncbi:MAG: trimethylamine methyltransferase family protein [Candidatus Bathyarchaeia archaeon]